MGLRHLLGYSLLIVGIALLPLLFLFYSNSQIYNPVFLYSLAIVAIGAVSAGSIILKRLS